MAPISNNDPSSLCQMDSSEFAALQELPGNTQCVDCNVPNPDWGSPNLGILMCFQCSGRHRGLGTHISFVRSVTMDKWTDRQLQLMKVGGNAQCNDFLRRHGVSIPSTTTTNLGGDPTPVSSLSSDSAIRTKYDSPAAELYQRVLVARIDNRPEPTDLQPPRATTTNNAVPRRKMEGFGSSPPPVSERPPWIQKMVVVGVVVGAVAIVGAVVAGSILH